jgi:hypothetical protein
MKELLQEVKEYLLLRKEAKAVSKQQVLNAEACRLVTIREVYTHPDSDVTQYGLFLGENLVDVYPERSQKLLERMFALREYYVNMWTGVYQVK